MAGQRFAVLVGWAEYGYSASHSRQFWGPRLHLIATPSGLPITFALAGAKADERDICSAMLSHAQIARDGQTIMADKGNRSADFAKQLKAAGISLIRPATKTEPPRAGKQFLKALRQTIASIYDTLKDQLGLERHGGRTRTGVCVRILQRILALTTVIWHNQTTNRPGPARSLIAYDQQNLGTDHIGAVVAHRCSFVCITRTRRPASPRSGHSAPVFTSDLRDQHVCCEHTGPLRHATGSPGLKLLRVLRPIPPASAGNGPLLPTSWMLAGEGTGGMVPTFGFQPFDRVGVQLCPCNIATATPQAFTWPPESAT